MVTHPTIIPRTVTHSLKIPNLSVASGTMSMAEIDQTRKIKAAVTATTFFHFAAILYALNKNIMPPTNEAPIRVSPSGQSAEPSCHGVGRLAEKSPMATTTASTVKGITSAPIERKTISAAFFIMQILYHFGTMPRYGKLKKSYFPYCGRCYQYDTISASV